MDAVDAVPKLNRSFKVPAHIEDKPSISDQWDDAEIMQRYADMDTFEDYAWVTRICADTVVKFGQDLRVPSAEALAIEFVRANTDIPVPRLRRTILHKGLLHMVIDYVEGKLLSEVWPTFSSWERFRVAWTLRRYIRQLRRISSPLSATPGPLGPSPRPCEGNMFGTRSRGPFADYAAMSKYYNDKLDLAKVTPYPLARPERLCAEPDTEPFDDSEPLVFSHLDLSMRNVIVGTDGRLWMIDWAWAGFYPRWFEYVATVSAADNDEAPSSWERVIPLITNPYFRQRRWLEKLAVVIY
ncbi:kinase-like domain-containing protein [Phellopilus nigrolimitatus]|nr:kinase-like domain-containing protein [Phellopilus nigrolimitatus]